MRVLFGEKIALTTVQIALGFAACNFPGPMQFFPTLYFALIHAITITISVHALVGYSSHFVSVCQSVTNLEHGELLALQRDMNLNWTTIYVPLIYHF